MLASDVLVHLDCFVGSTESRPTKSRWRPQSPTDKRCHGCFPGTRRRFSYEVTIAQTRKRENAKPPFSTEMEKSEKIFVAGARGMVGSALVRRLEADGFGNLLKPDRG